MIRFRRLAFTFLVLMVHADVGKSCESLTVRDAAFQEPRDLHRVVLLTHEGDEGIDAIDARLRAWFATHEKEVNLEYVKVDVDQEGIDWSDYGIPGPPPSTPATLLV